MSEAVRISDMKVDFDPEYIGVEGFLWSDDFGWHRGKVWVRKSGEVIGSATGFLGVTWTHWQPLPPAPN